MKTFIKSFAIILAFAMLLSLAACGNQGESIFPAPTEADATEAVSATEPAEPTAPAATEPANETADDEYAENPNYAFSGSVVYDNEYTYFVNVKDGENGEVFRIVRIGNEKDSEPTVIYSMADPASVDPSYSGGSFNKISGLSVSESRVYFFERLATDKNARLKWVAKDGSDSGVANCSFNEPAPASDGEWESPNRIRLINEGSYIYITDFIGSIIKFDMNTETEEEISLSPLMGADEQCWVLGVHRNRAYYIKVDPDTGVITNGIYYTDLDDLEEKELCSMDMGSLSGYPAFSGSYMFFSTEERVVESIDLETGSRYTVYTFEKGEDTYFLFRNGLMYFIKGSDFWTVNADGSEAKPLIEDADKDNNKWMIQIAGDWIYYNRAGRNDPEFYRISVDGRIFPSAPICEGLDCE